MRVALLGPFPSMADRVGGGPEAVVVQLAHGLQRAGVEVHVVTFDFTRQAAADTVSVQDGITVHRLRLRRLPRWTGIRVNARVLSRELRALAPDICHAHSGGTFGDGALSSGLPAVITIHGVIEREAEAERKDGISWREDAAWRYEIWYERHSLGVAQDVIAISPYVIDQYRGLTSARMHLIENPVAETYFDVADRTEPASVLCAARIIHRKNILGLLQAFALLRRDLPEARLRLAGETSSEPAYVQQCQAVIAANGLTGAVDFLGWLNEAELQREYGRCSALALVSWQETAPVVIEQAMAAGKPVVAGDSGGVRYLVQNGVTGFVVRPDDAAGQAMALRQVLTDDVLRRRMGDAGRVAAQARFHPDQVTAQTIAVYQRAIASQTPGASSRLPNP